MRREGLRGPEPVAALAADPGGVAEHYPGRHAAEELEDVAEPLADALGVLAGEQLRDGGVGARGPALPGAGPGLAGGPAEVEEAPGGGGDLGAHALDEPAHGPVGRLAAALVAEPLVDALGAVPLLVPAPGVLLEPPPHHGLVGVDAALPPGLGAGRGRGQVGLGQVLADRGLGAPGGPGDLGHAVAPPPHLPHLLDFVHLYGHPFWPFSSGSGPGDARPLLGAGRPTPRQEKISCPNSQKKVDHTQA